MSASLPDSSPSPIPDPGATARSELKARKARGRRDGLLAIGLVFLLTLTVFSAVATAWQATDPRPLIWAGLQVDRLSGVLTLLVAGVGTVVYRFSLRYLDGDPRQGQFLGYLILTIAAAYLLMLAGNLLVLFLAWALTSAGLHRLLLHCADRPEAVRAARKKFVISRLGDVALLAAIVVAWFNWGTLDFGAMATAAKSNGASFTASAVAFLVVLAALTKSAQFPFHSWLPETMEAPTPVSALMHAGIINAGGALLLKFAPLLVQVSAALFLLAIAGTLTVALGLIAMWAQVKVKRTLAWSTVAQMGFMMMQCGLGAFGAAALHIVAHGFYKAWSFLAAGELPAAPAVKPPVATGRALLLATIGTLVAIPAAWASAVLTGFNPLQSPGELALTVVVLLSAGQAWVALLGQPGATLTGTASATAVTFLGVAAAFALYHGAELFLTPVLGPAAAQMAAEPTGWAWAAAAVPIVVLVGLAVLHACLPILGRTVAGRAFRAHALHGFYFGAIADRLVAALHPATPHPAHNQHIGEKAAHV